MNRRELMRLGTAAGAGLLLHESARAQEAHEHLPAPAHSPTHATDASLDWAVNATIIDGCSCRLLCPCIFGSTAEVGTVGTHKHDETTFCYFNAAFLVNKGNYGRTSMDGMKFWFAGDKGDAKTVELTFEPSATKEQREGVRVFLAHFLPQEWTSLTEGPDASIDFAADATHAEARLDGGNAAEVVMSRFSGAMGQGTVVINNMKYFAAPRNDGFYIMPVDQLVYRRGPKPTPFEFRGTSGWTITVDMDSNDVGA
jgi:hypothetical protein